MGLVVALTGVAGIAAYLTSGDTATNELVVGGVTSEIIEEFEPPKELKPGTSFKKDVKVKNNGVSDCYVRIKAAFTDSEMESRCTVDYNKTDFIYNEQDGYYYYPKPIKKDEETPSLFTMVTLDPNLSQSEIQAFDILIYHESYQANGFSDYQSAWNNFEKNEIGNISK